MCVYLVFHVCVKECNCDVKDCGDFSMTVFCVTLTGCFCDQHAEHFQCGCACKHVVTFVLIDFHTDKSSAHKITFVVCDDLHAHVCAVSSLTFLGTSNHPKRFQLIKLFLSTRNVLGSVKQLSGKVVIQETVLIDFCPQQNPGSLSQSLTSRLFVHLDVHRSSSDLRCSRQHCLASIVFLLHVS